MAKSFFLKLYYCFFFLNSCIFSYGQTSRQISEKAAPTKPAEYINELNNYKNECLNADFSVTDITYMLSALFLSPDVIFTKKEKRLIENYIQKHIKTDLDTMQLYQWSIFKLSFYEFVMRDYKKAIKTINDFDSKIPSKGLIDLYPAMRFSTQMRISDKRKKKKSPNISWISSRLKNLLHSQNDSQENINQKPHENLPWRNNHQTLLSDILQSIPSSLQTKTYKLILNILYHEDTKIEELCNFVFKMIETKNIDIVVYILNKWKINNDSHTTNLALHGLVSYAISLQDETMVSSILAFFPINTQNTAKIQSKILANSLQLEDLKNLVYISFSKNKYSLGYNTAIIDAIKNIFGEDSNEYKFVSNNIHNPSILIIPFQEQIAQINAQIERNSNNDNLSSDIMTILNQLYGQYNYLQVCKICELYKQYIALNDLSNFYNLWGLSETSIGLYSKGLTHLRLAENYSPNDRTITQNIGSILCEMGDYDEALSIYNKYVSVKDDDFNIFYTYDQLGYIYSNINQDASLFSYKKAARYIDNYTTLNLDKKVRHYLRYSRAVESNKYLQRKYIEKAKLCATNVPLFSLNIDSISLGAVYAELGYYYNSIFDYKQANFYYLQAFDCMKRLTQENRHIRSLKIKYSQNLIDEHKFIEAQKTLQELKETIINVIGKDNTEYATVIRSLLLIAIKLKDINKATELFNEFDMLTKRHTTKETDLYKNMEVRIMWDILSAQPITLIEDLKKILSVTNLNPKTLSTISQYLSFIDKDEHNFAPIIKEFIKQIKKTSIKQLINTSSKDWYNIIEPLNQIRSNLVNCTYDRTKLVSYGANFSLFTKGLLFNTKSKIEQSQSFNKKTAKEIMFKIQQKKDSMNLAITKCNFTFIPSITNKIDSLERELYNQYANSEYILRKMNFNYSDVCLSIGKNSLAIDFVKYTVNCTNKYGAYIYSQKLQSPLFIPICDEKNIKLKIEEEKGDINYTFYRNKQNKGDSYNLIWGNLIPYFSDYKNIYFSGDGLLNLLAIEYLCDENDVQICDQYRLHRVFHLADIKHTQSIGNNFIAIGVSDHNSPVKNVLEKERGTWSDLTGVKDEFDIINSKFKLFNPNIQTSYIMNDMAREQYIKSLNKKNITTIHIATHGFYKSKSALEEAASDSSDFDYNISIRTLKSNKESLSGLILRQGNLSWKSPTIGNEEDDILTSDEIENLTFPKLNLTVLSACETGIGNINSEGVWGLQRAFRIAGTESLICSLCKIDDEWTVRFMEIFYEQVCQGKTIYDSFHKARAFLFNNKKKVPKIWSSMILIE